MGGDPPPGGGPKPDGHDRAGHRKRLRERFSRGGPDALADYELLELLLFQALPRRDVKPLAKRLIERFEGFSQTIGADPDRIKEVKGAGDSVVEVLKTVEAAMHRALRERVMREDVIANWQDVLNYCKGSMQDRTTEQFRILFLDKRNVVIADEIQQEGTVDHTPVYPREVVRRALELRASAIVMVHNHPSGDPEPSSLDMETTRLVIEAGKTVGIDVHDHVVIGHSGHRSFKSMGLL